MKQSFIRGIHNNAILIVALAAFVVLSGNRNAGIGKDVASKCCSGYSITTDKLQQFMLDSLHGIQFEGGVYSKSKLLAALNQIPGDSVYLLNTLLNCDVNKGTDLAITSPQANGLVWVSKPGCNPCPGKPCCTPKVCVARIERSCINYRNFRGLVAGSAATDNTAGK